MYKNYKYYNSKWSRSSADDYTGHDRFCQERVDRKRRKPVIYTKAQSQAQEKERDKEKTTSRDISLFSCVKQNKEQTQENNRHGGRYEYMALEAEGGGQERLELERKAKEEAHTACTHYLKGCPRYTLLQHLKDIGSRMDKHWFVVRDTSVKTERLLTLVPKGPGCILKCDSSTRATVLDLFLNLQHPYIYPVLDLEFRGSPSTQETYIVLVIPYNAKGSLKDLIYKSVWQEDWGDKYGEKSEGLPISQVQRLGRQILEALLFLKERGFPPCSHLHSGNIIIQNGVARLSGLENVLFGFTSRIYPIISKRFRHDPTVIDVICFGHVLFEMCAGYELTVAVPTAANLLDISTYPQVVDVLEFIFNNPKERFPSIEELLLSDFFRNIDLREMRATSLPVYHARLTPSTLALLNDVKKHQKTKRGRRSQSTSMEANTPPPTTSHREHSDSEEVKDSDVEVEEEDFTGGSHEDSDTDTGQEYEHRHLSLHLYQNLSPVKLQDDDMLR
ncbi:slowpoke-binding protein isoform X2 [Cimex lectularius]|uniref:Slowpoke-binding protein n=1 Tax=Cimex lectularius TaxID=79782 RepID=A0A8I6R8T8_CIMLE|nr:slowpoke-binding protein isoform X2 [Cimex lectularius]